MRLFTLAATFAALSFLPSNALAADCPKGRCPVPARGRTAMASSASTTVNVPRGAGREFHPLRTVGKFLFGGRRGCGR